MQLVGRQGVKIMGRVRCFSHVVASPLEIGGAGCRWVVVFNWCLVFGDGESVLSGFLGLFFFFALVLGLLAGWGGGAYMGFTGARSEYSLESFDTFRADLKLEGFAAGLGWCSIRTGSKMV